MGYENRSLEIDSECQAAVQREKEVEDHLALERQKNRKLEEASRRLRTEHSQLKVGRLVSEHPST